MSVKIIMTVLKKMNENLLMYSLLHRLIDKTDSLHGKKVDLKKLFMA